MAELKNDPIKQIACSDLSRVLLPAVTGFAGGVAGSALGPAGTIGGAAIAASIGNAAQQEYCDGSVKLGQVALAGALGATGGAAGVLIKSAQATAAVATAAAAAPEVQTAVERFQRVEKFIQQESNYLMRARCAPDVIREILQKGETMLENGSAKSMRAALNEITSSGNKLITQITGHSTHIIENGTPEAVIAERVLAAEILKKIFPK